jgi:hypothetical protein
MLNVNKLLLRIAINPRLTMGCFSVGDSALHPNHTENTESNSSIVACYSFPGDRLYAANQLLPIWCIVTQLPGNGFVCL